MATSNTTCQAIDRARAEAGLSQRALAHRTGIAQATLSRIITGSRQATMPEIILIAEATGWTPGQLTGHADLSHRVQEAARATNSSDMRAMRDKLMFYLELNDFLHDYAIPEVD
ncbi:helix-turn-helix transcriptional regulator [Corynebacterium sp.]|uniref:helix-turn-helix domain-containing protein n=1 Tax=Corynebacterium sp. TaxID=1720 RepID=UPI0026E02ABA|nr:helix-turn-helix transcriptional regulator [Corynebacterium sp.]MDO5511643.1 helix-turn-helix transcriptional regulator [Corynebacterium sp.]